METAPCTPRSGQLCRLIACAVKPDESCRSGHELSYLNKEMMLQGLVGSSSGSIDHRMLLDPGFKQPRSHQIVTGGGEHTGITVPGRSFSKAAMAITTGETQL